MCFQFPLSDTETHDYVLTCASGLHQREKKCGGGVEGEGGWVYRNGTDFTEECFPGRGLFGHPPIANTL